MWLLTDDESDGKFLPVELSLWLKVGVRSQFPSSTVAKVGSAVAWGRK